ncbi:MAG TPA: hypothetical protein PK156_18975 [Polyangium sp.]|nr:hypothetical protein [Polyangium sp.]
MTESRHLRLIAATGLLCASLVAVGCGDDKLPTTTTSGSSSSSSGNGGSGGGGGGSGGMGTPSATLDAAVTNIRPFDAAPDSTANNVYVIGLDANGEPVISQGKMDGSAPSTALVTGGPLVAPVNIAVSTDDSKVYVTDPGAEDANGKPGQIFGLPTAGGTATALTNASGYRARGLEIMSENGKDMIYFAGTDAAGLPGVYKVPADDSGAVVVVAQGAPMVDPSGIVLSKEGVVYVCDTVQDTDGRGSIIEIAGGNATTMVKGILAGFPCGISLTEDETTVLVSGFSPLKHTDAVIKIDAVTKDFAYVTDGIDTFVESAGLHRAKQGGNNFAWADTTSNGNLGTVFKLTLK